MVEIVLAAPLQNIRILLPLAQPARRDTRPWRFSLLYLSSVLGHESLLISTAAMAARRQPWCSEIYFARGMSHIG